MLIYFALMQNINDLEYSKGRLVEFYSLILENFLLFIVDSKGNIQDFNNRFLQELKYQKEEILDKNIFDFIDLDLSDKINLSEILSNQEIQYLLIKFLGKDKTTLWTKSIVLAKENSIFFLIKPIREVLNILENEKFRNVIYEIQKLSLEIADLKTFLDKTLEVILSIEWLSIEAKAGFMLNIENELKLISYLNVEPSLVQMCHRVPFGRCLCGRAAEKKEIIYKPCVDEEHENRPEGMQPHGHYNIPILHGNYVLGVLFVYLENEFPKKEEHLEFFKELASTLTLVILKFQFEQEYQYTLSKQIRINDELVKNIKEVQKLQKLFKTYIPDFIQNLINNHHSQGYSFYKENKYYLLVNISGILGFSSIFPIQKVYETLTEFYSSIVDTVLEYKGEIEQYLEDKIFGIFPTAKDTIECSIKVYKEIKKINAKRESLFLKPFKFQIALHYGESFVGIMGSSKRKNWIRYGETIRWLEAMQKKCQFDNIIVSEMIYEECKDEYTFSKRYKLIRNKIQNSFLYVRYLQNF